MPDRQPTIKTPQALSGTVYPAPSAKRTMPRDVTVDPSYVAIIRN